MAMSTASGGNGFGIPDFFSQQASSNVQQQQLLTDDIFSLATPPGQTSTNSFFPATTATTNANAFAAFPTNAFQPSPFQNVLDTNVPTSK
jgi:hypothetical protein